MKEQISKSRILLRNPYAHLNGEGEFDAIERGADTALADQLTIARIALQNPYAYLEGDGEFSLREDIAVKTKKSEFKLNPEALKRFTRKRTEQKISYSTIEQLAFSLQKELWEHRSILTQGTAQTNPIDLLEPSIAINALGYEFVQANSLGQFPQNGTMMEVAGIIDKDKGQIQISKQFSASTQRFTAAHELGHAILHDAQGLHRDRPLDGSKVSGIRDMTEIQADKFATYFLMPEKLIRTVFKRFFYSDPFKLNEDTMFALGQKAESKIRKNKDLRALARVLASTEVYNGRNFKSLANQFGVSAEAMAIRLEELEMLSIS